MLRSWLAWLRFWGLLPTKVEQPEPETPKGYLESKGTRETVVKVDFVAKQKIKRRQ